MAKIEVVIDGDQVPAVTDLRRSRRRRLLGVRAWNRTTCAAGRRKASCDKGGVVNAAQVVLFRSRKRFRSATHRFRIEAEDITTSRVFSDEADTEAPPAT